MDRMPIARLPPIGSQNAASLSPRASRKYEGLTGPSYMLQSTHSYQLPPPGVIKPFQDTRAGALDTWPAHAADNVGSMASVALTKNKQMVVVDDEEMGKPRLVPKPKFLDKLEGFLKKELRALGVTSIEPNELRLQAHREVLEYLIEDFKTYKPLLSAIKNEYEMMLAHYREQIRQLEPLKQMLVTVSEHCDQKIMQIRDQEKQDVIDLKKENSSLYKKIDECRQDEQALKIQVEKLQEELAAEYLRYWDECDARKLLVSDINDLRYQQEDIDMARQSMAELDDEKDDPVTLRIALKKAREDEYSATQRLNEIMANYGDVIPRRDYEALEKTHQELLEKVDVMKHDFLQLKAEHDNLFDVHKQVIQQRDEFYVECETLRRSATPRPEWNRCADHVAGGAIRWKDLSEGKTSNELVDVLLGEIAGGGGGDSGAVDYFDAKGMGEDVPKYLRAEGSVRNRNIGKRDCSLMIKDIWREKGIFDAQKTNGSREKMADFVHSYLKQHFGLEKMVTEWGYNLDDAARRYSHDERIGYFCKVLNNEADEELYYLQLQSVAKLLGHLSQLDTEKAELLPKDSFKQGLQSYFPTLEEEQILALVNAAEVELDAKDAESIQYTNLFMEDDEGRTGPFLDEVRKQLNDERYSYVEDIKTALEDNNPVTVEDLRKALTLTDPEIEQADLEKYLMWAFRVSMEKLAEAEPPEIDTLIERLKNGNIRRIGKKPSS